MHSYIIIFYFFFFFRNLYFLGPFIFLCMTALFVGGLENFLKTNLKDNFKRKWCIFYVILVHMGLIIYLSSQEGVLWTLYATLFSSMVLFILHFLGIFNRRRFIFLIVLMLIAMLQPSQIITKFLCNTKKVNTCSLEKGSFAYTRPLRGKDLDAERGYGLSFKKKQDKSGFCREGYYGTHYSFLLHSNISAENLEKYVSPVQ